MRTPSCPRSPLSASPVCRSSSPLRSLSFAGRASELATLTGLLRGLADTVVISGIGGMAGVDKTALAVHWAHRVRRRSPTVTCM
jgi:hypothetical protein